MMASVTLPSDARVQNLNTLQEAKEWMAECTLNWEHIGNSMTGITVDCEAKRLCIWKGSIGCLSRVHGGFFQGNTSMLLEIQSDSAEIIQEVYDFIESSMAKANCRLVKFVCEELHPNLQIIVRVS